MWEVSANHVEMSIEKVQPSSISKGLDTQPISEGLDCETTPMLLASISQSQPFPFNCKLKLHAPNYLLRWITIPPCLVCFWNVNRSWEHDKFLCSTHLSNYCKKNSPSFNPFSIPINDASPQGNISKLHFPFLKKQNQNTPQHALRTPLELPLKGEHLTFQVTTLEKHA